MYTFANQSSATNHIALRFHIVRRHPDNHARQVNISDSSVYFSPRQVTNVTCPHLSLPQKALITIAPASQGARKIHVIYREPFYPCQSGYICEYCQANTMVLWGSKGRGVGVSHLLPAAVAAAASGIVGEEISGICWIPVLGRELLWAPPHCCFGLLLLELESPLPGSQQRHPVCETQGLLQWRK